MPRYKLSPEERAAEKERKENLRNIMKGLDVKNFDDLKDVFKMMVGEMLENGLDGELDDELGYHELAYTRTKDEVTYEFAYLEGELFDDYLHDMNIVQNFARLNRQAIAADIIKSLKFTQLTSFSTVHNYIDTENKILRKGAISAQDGETMIIPLNMRDGCLICKGKGNADWNCSAPHGAGRAFNRTDTVNAFTLSRYKKEMQGIYSTSVSRDTLDECPMAYKDSNTIMEQIRPTVEVIEKLTPVYNFKAGAR